MEDSEVTQGMPQEQQPTQSPDALKAELEFLRAVYGEIRSEIRNDESKIVNNINYTLAGAGAAIALSSLIVPTKQYMLLLFLPFIFYILALTAYNHHLGIFRLANYLLEVIYPRIRDAIVELDGGSHDFGVFSVDWDAYRHRGELPRLISLPLAASHYGLHLLFSLLPLALFFYYKQDSHQLLNVFELSLIILNGLGFLVLAAYLVGFRIVSRKLTDQLRVKA